MGLILDQKLMDKIIEDEHSIRNITGQKKIDILGLVKKGLIEIHGYNDDGTLKYRTTQLGKTANSLVGLFMGGK